MIELSAMKANWNTHTFRCGHASGTDEDYVKARKLIISGIKQDPEAAVASSSYFMVIRLLERIGDHVVNLAQWVIYKMSGELVDLNTKDTDEMTEL